MQNIRASVSFLAIGILLAIYTFIFVDNTHNFMLNFGWENNLIEAKWLMLLIAGMGVALALFYYFFADNMYSNTLIHTHVVFYFLLALILVLWDNNSFSLQEAVESQSYSSVREIRKDYHDIADRSNYYRGAFWLMLILQPIGLVNLLLGFLKTNTK